MSELVRRSQDKDIIWKEEKRVVNIPYCPVCKKELREMHIDYKPYWCDCGDWYWSEDDSGYKIYKPLIIK